MSIFGSFMQGYNMGKSAMEEAGNRINSQLARRAEIRDTAIREENAAIANAADRGVVDYHPCPVDCLFDSSSPEQSVIVSGGTRYWHNEFIKSLILPYCNASIPVIIFHHSNNQLKADIKGNFENFVNVDENNRLYDPIIGLNIIQIVNLVLSCHNEYIKLSPESSYYFQGINEFMQCKNVIPSIYAFASLPYMEIATKINIAVNKGQMTATQAQKIQQLLSRGANEQSSIQLFFESLLNDCPFVSRKLDTKSILNVEKAIVNKKNLIIDIPNSASDTLLKMILADVKKATSLNQKFVLVVDDLQIANNKEFNDFIASFPDSNPLFLLSQDVYSYCNGEEARFYPLAGKFNKKLIMKHSSAVSANKWSAVFGDYERQEVTHNYGYSTTNNMSNVNHGTSTSRNKENRILAEAIVKMGDGEIYLADTNRPEIAHMMLKR